MGLVVSRPRMPLRARMPSTGASSEQTVTTQPPARMTPNGMVSKVSTSLRVSVMGTSKMMSE